MDEDEDDAGSDDVESGPSELLDVAVEDDPCVAFDDEMLEEESDLDVLEEFLDDGLNRLSSGFGSWMSPVRTASSTSQGSCLLFNVRTLDTVLVAGSAVMMTCSGLVSSGMVAGLSLHLGLRQSGMETLAYLVLSMFISILAGREPLVKLTMVLLPITIMEDESGTGWDGIGGIGGTS